MVRSAGDEIPARHDSLMSGPEGRIERFCSPWNSSRYRKVCPPALSLSAGMARKEMAVRENHETRISGGASGLFSTRKLSRLLPFVNSILAKIVPFSKKNDDLLIIQIRSVFLIGRQG